jgi:hypothetical protein
MFYPENSIKKLTHQFRNALYFAELEVEENRVEKDVN